MRIIRNNMWAFYLGGALGGFAGLRAFEQWEFWAIFVPVAFLVELRRDQ